MFNYILNLVAFMAGLGPIFTYFNIISNFTILDILIVFAIIIRMFSKKTLLLTKNEGVAIVLLGLIQVLSALSSSIKGNMDNSQDINNLMIGVRTIYYSLLVLLINKTNFTFTKDRLISILKSYRLGVALNILNILFLFFKLPRYWHGLPFFNTQYLNRNTVYYPLVIGVGIQYLLLKKAKSVLEKILGIIILITSTVISMLTFSKGAYLVLVINVIMILFFEIKSNKKMFGYVLIAATALLLFIKNSVIYKVFFETKMTNYNAEEDFRLIYKIDALKVGLNHLFVGCGTGNHYNGLIEMGSSHLTHDPHDVAGMIFSENGLIALLLYVFIIIMFFFKLNKCRTAFAFERNMIFVFLIIYIVLSFLTGTVFTGKIFPFMCILVEFIYNHSINEEEILKYE